MLVLKRVAREMIVSGAILTVKCTCTTASRRLIYAVQGQGSNFDLDRNGCREKLLSIFCCGHLPEFLRPDILVAAGHGYI